VSKQNILTSIIALIPLSYILGNFILNLNILFIILGGLTLYIKGHRIKLIFLDKLILVFFSFIIFTGTWNTIESYYFINIENHDFSIIIKSILFLRYLILYFAIRLFLEKDLINFKIIFFVYAALSSFVILDIIIQFYLGKNIFGLTSPFVHKRTGIFYTEAIAGGFIQKFSLFLFFTFAVYSKIKNIKIKISLLTLFLFLAVLSIIFSGNRMPLILFLLGIFLIFIQNKSLKKYFLYIAISTILLFIVSISSSSHLKNYYLKFYDSSKEIFSLYTYRITGVGNDLNFKDRPVYVHEFDSGIGTWKLNKFIGGGLKAFRYNCPKRQIKSINERTTCNIHPHNYYLEILADLGIVGILLFILIIFLTYKQTYKFLNNEKIKYTISPFFYIFLLEIFPIRSSGSFFTTNNAIFFFLALSVIIGLSEKIKER